MFQLGLYWIIFVVLALFVVNYPAGVTVWRFWGTVLSLTGLLAANFVWADQRRAASPLTAVQDWIFLIASAALVLAAAWLSGQSEVAYLLAMVCAQAGFRRGVWPAGVVFGAANLVVWLGYLLLMRVSLTALIAVESALTTGIVLVLLLVALLNQYARQTRRAEALVKELQAAHAQLEAAHQQEKSLAIAEERIRLARDIHDGLGHHLTVLSIQLQAADKLVARDPEAAAQAIRVCRAETQAALEEVRHSVSVMRQTPTESRPLPDELGALVHDFDRHTGISASFACRGAPAELPLPAQETLFRAVQEGLTNVQKHAAHVRQVSVCLTYEPGSVCLLVKDDGQGPAAADASPRSGFGLAGLRERVTHLGGAFRSGPGETPGFEVEVCLPFQR